MTTAQDLLSSVNTESLPSQVIVEFPVREIVPGRVVYIDADFISYLATVNEDATLQQMKESCDYFIDRMQKAAGAERAELHITSTKSTKGNRNNIALLSDYQANRVGRAKPSQLETIREFLHKERGALLAVDLEADDTIAAAAYAAMARGESNLCVVATKDKDLTMIPCIQVNWDTGAFSELSDEFGYIQLDRTKSSPKIVGRGWAYFWAQMLTGDSADNISGLPKAVIAGKAKRVGAVTAYGLLENAKSNEQAFRIVATAYKEFGELEGFKNWRDGSPVSWQDAFYSEAKLIWMRRTNKDDDVVDWLKEQFC